jgi:transposase
MNLVYQFKTGHYLKQFLRVIKNAMNSNHEYRIGFNNASIEIKDKKILLYSDYYKSEILISLSRFKINLLRFYKKYPNAYDDGILYDKIEIPGFENQLNSLIM